MGAPLEEQLCRVEITKDSASEEYVAKVYTNYDGTKEFRNRDVERLLRELTLDLEFSFGETVRRAQEEITPFDEEGGFVEEDRF